MLTDTVSPNTPTSTVDRAISIEPQSSYVVVSVEIDGGNYEIALSGNALSVAESGMPDELYLPAGDVVPQMLVASSTVRQCPNKGEVRYFNLELWGHIFEDIAWMAHPDAALGQNIAQLRDRIAFDTSRVNVITM
tara:strand:- start:622 stop:1026 length:405 start_codon:yes stop_codon:yes gene_type:complete